MVGIPEKSAFPVAKAVRGEETVTLRGTSRGFELIIADGVDADAIIGSVVGQLSKSPGFFAGSDVTIQFAGHPIVGSLGQLEEVAAEFGLTIVAIRSGLEERRETTKAALAVVSDLLDPADEATDSIELDFDSDDYIDDNSDSESDSDDDAVLVATDEPAAVDDSWIPEASDPVAEFADAADVEDAEDVETSEEMALEAEAAPVAVLAPTPSGSTPAVSPEAFDAVRALALQAPDAAKIVIGPVRSGCILEATEHIVIVGDVNPGAEVTSIGAIVVLGRMRGIAHAGAGGNPAFIFALQLEPQQLRLGTKVARASDGDACGARPEIARIENNQIIVEPYAGRLPFSLASVLS